MERGLPDAEVKLTKTDWGRARDFRAGARDLLVQSLGYGVKPEIIGRLDLAILQDDYFSPRPLNKVGVDGSA